MSDGPVFVPPQRFVERAWAILEGRTDDWTVPEVRDAATVVLLRDTAEGIEVFLMRRVSTMAFAAGMHVFPGGRLDPDDHIVPLALASPEQAHALDLRLGAAPGVGAALLAAATRETFEECGVLLVTGQAAPVARDDLWEQRRQALLDTGQTFSELLYAEGLVVDTAAIRPWTHWITPPVEERRYNTRFFVAAMPVTQEAGDVSGESDRVHWMRPADALERWAAGDLALMTPTSDTLRTLLPYATAAEVLQAADERTIVPQMPQPSLDASGALRWMLIDASTGEMLLELGLEDV
ncbi:MAG: NUDIX hydrolase [Actinobacteria bacterium]|uniref:Unannotated protein n=1 Tax=freshwater metagenome TaxID=449393 RepID=A0A6J7IJI0_9ZZZZ|nr:NUDIX hydrolase [Actinomycetota bacterium]MSW40831.1 NUDIX hydrolase [Actinomycetota bacterium]